MSQNVTWNGTTYAVPDPSNVNWGTDLTAFLVALGNNAAINAEMKQAVRVATTSPVTVSDTTDCVVATNLSVAGAVAVNLPAGTDGRWFVVVDQRGDAASNNITITRNGSDTINGSTTYVISENNGGIVLVYSATNTRWNVIARFTAGTPFANPMSAIGQLIYGGASGVATALAVGTKGQQLNSEGSAAPTWSWPGRINAVSSANYSVTSTDGYSKILMTTGASDRTVSLPAVASNTGRVIRIEKVDSGAGKVLITCNGAEQIELSNTNELHARFSFVTLLCTGSTWLVESAWDEVSASRVRSAGVALTSTVSANVLASAISVSAGHWVFTAAVGGNPGAATTVTDSTAAVSAVSATLPSADTFCVPTSGEVSFNDGATRAANQEVNMTVTTSPVFLQGTGDYYLVTNMIFSGGTGVSAYGSLTAVRVK